MKNIIASAVIALTVTPALAKPPLSQQPRVTEGVMAAATAFEIGRICPSLSARRLRGIQYLLQIQGVAKDLGYSSAEINAFRNDKAERARLERIARRRLAAKGVVTGQPETYCRVGRAEIASGSTIGQLLRD